MTKNQSKPGDMYNAYKKKLMKKKTLRSAAAVVNSEQNASHQYKSKKKMMKPKPQGKGIVKALGQKGTTGNFKKIEAAKGKGAAIAALQNKLAAHRGQPIPFKAKTKMKHVAMAKEVVKAGNKKQVKGIVKIQKSHIKGKMGMMK